MNRRIDWARFEQETGLRPSKIAEMAGISASRWSQIKGDQDDTLKDVNLFAFGFQMAKNSNFAGKKFILEEAEVLIDQFLREIEQDYGLAEGCSD